MKYKIAVYGLTNDQELLLEATLPEEYELVIAECVTDLIVTDATCTIIESSSLDKNSLNTLLAYYMDVGDRLDETVVWLGDAELPKLPSFVRCDSFLDLLTELDSILTRAQVRYDTMQMYGSEYAYLPKHAIEESIEADIHTALRCKYGKDPDPMIRKRLRQELTALREVDGFPDLAAAWELSRWLKARNIPFFVEHVTASGLIPYLLGITHTNPLPPHAFCPQCKKVCWQDGTEICCNCGSNMIRDGHDLIWQEYVGFGRLPDYGFWLPVETKDLIRLWVENHWLKLPVWDPEEQDKCRLGAGNFYFVFALQSRPNHRKPTAYLPPAEAQLQELGLSQTLYRNPTETEKLLQTYHIPRQQLPAFREDVYRYLKSHGFSDQDAFRGMNCVRKGKGLPVVTEDMQTAEDHWKAEYFNQIEWLPSQAMLVERLLFAQIKKTTEELL